MIAVRKLWRYTQNTLSWPDSDSELETVLPGERCDWAAGGFYEANGWAVSLEEWLRMDPEKKQERVM